MTRLASILAFVMLVLSGGLPLHVDDSAPILGPLKKFYVSKQTLGNAFWFSSLSLNYCGNDLRAVFSKAFGGIEILGFSRLL